MEEINFLSNQSKDKSRKDNKEKNGKQIEWSDPAKAGGVKINQGGSIPSGWFSFFKKDKISEPDKRNTAFQKSSHKNELDLVQEPPIAGKEKKNNFNKTAKNPKPKKSFKKQAKRQEEDQEWENPDILETNLIKDEIVSFFDWRKGAINLIITCLFPFFIIGAIYGFLFFWEKQINFKNQDIVGKINEIGLRIEETETDVQDILLFQEKLKIAEQLLDEHIYWTNFFKFLEDHTLANVFYEGFGGDISGNYALTAKAKNFHTIARQIKTMRANDNVLLVNVDSGQSDSGSGGEESGVSFKLDLSIKPNIFTE